jgi:hypothetical protein
VDSRKSVGIATNWLSLTGLVGLGDMAMFTEDVRNSLKINLGKILTGEKTIES